MIAGFYMEEDTEEMFLNNYAANGGEKSVTSHGETFVFWPDIIRGTCKDFHR